MSNSFLISRSPHELFISWPMKPSSLDTFNYLQPPACSSICLSMSLPVAVGRCPPSQAQSSVWVPDIVVKELDQCAMICRTFSYLPFYSALCAVTLNAAYHVLPYLYPFRPLLASFFTSFRHCFLNHIPVSRVALYRSLSLPPIFLFFLFVK
jgi:hypothetical protein